MRKFDRKLILEDGSEYYGYGFGAEDERITEIVFNTAPVGYQEILSDPSYTYQTVVMAYPLIGNYGITEEDFETETPTIGGWQSGITTISHRTSAANIPYLKSWRSTGLREFMELIPESWYAPSAIWEAEKY